MMLALYVHFASDCKYPSIVIHIMPYFQAYKNIQVKHRYEGQGDREEEGLQLPFP